MKTTVELPANLLHRAKFIAAQRRTTLKNLMITGLEQVLRESTPADTQSAIAEEEAFLELDSYGVPVLKHLNHPSARVTNDSIDNLREELGI